MSFTAHLNSEKIPFLNNVKSAKKISHRMIGLLKHSHLPQDEGLWILPCHSIHTFFMRFSIDVVFLDDTHKVIDLYHSLRPYKLSRFVPKARSVIEMSSGILHQYNVKLGDHITLQEVNL